MCLSFENDKKIFEKAINPGKPFFLFFKNLSIVSISSFDNLPPLYKVLFEANNNAFDKSPSYNTLI